MNSIDSRKLTTSRRVKSKMRLTVLASMTVIMLTLLNGCAAQVNYETSRAICRELERDLPTYSTRDTPETLESGAHFLDVFDAVCAPIK